jgi:four helix bundle protein
MAGQSFEDLDIWKRGCQLAVLVYQSLEGVKDYALRDQMQRSAVSIPSNIAEGSERSRKDFARFLRIAIGSAAELRTQCYIACRIGLLDKLTMTQLVDETKQLAKMMQTLVNRLK